MANDMSHLPPVDSLSPRSTESLLAMPRLPVQLADRFSQGTHVASPAEQEPQRDTQVRQPLCPVSMARRRRRDRLAEKGDCLVEQLLAPGELIGLD
jgi:hypothetical protein